MKWFIYLLSAILGGLLPYVSIQLKITLFCSAILAELWLSRKVTDYSSSYAGAFFVTGIIVGYVVKAFL